MQQSMSVRVERGSLKRPQQKGPKLESSSTAAISTLCHIEDDTKLTECPQSEISMTTHHESSKTDSISDINDILSEMKLWKEIKKQRRRPRTRRNAQIEIAFDIEQINSSSSSPSISFHGLFIFDWDDTLFPTSVLRRDRLLTFDQDEFEAICQDLHALIDAVTAVFRAIKTRKNAEIKIITSATEKWIKRIFNGEYSKTLQPVFQRLQKLLLELEIEIISARDRCVFKGRNQRRTRKKSRGRDEKAECMKQAFAEFKKKTIDEKKKESVVPVVYSIGDGMDEWDASQDAFRQVFGCHFETISLLQRIKLERNPESITYMKQQMETVDFIIRSDTNTKYLNYIATEHQIIDYME